MKSRIKQRPVDVQQVIKFLSVAFTRAHQTAFENIGNRNGVGTRLYEFQVEFCYLVHDIENGPSYIAPKKIAEANKLIDRLAKL